MRQIKFRGKRPNSGKWITGSLVQLFGFSYILNDEHRTSDCSTEVLPDTVSQFTGLTDRNGKEVYEGDILETKYEDRCEESGFGIARNGVYFKIGCFGTIGEITREFLPFSDYPIKDEYIIGNIHDNPELIK